MNIYFIFPLVIQRASRESHRYHPFLPLGLVYLATLLKHNGHNVEIADRNEILIKNNYDFALADKELLEKIKVFKPQIVGFSATTPLMYDVVHFSKEIKNNFPNIVSIVGGPHPTAEPRETLISCPDIDLVVEGEGEMTMLELVKCFPDTDVAGVWRRDGNGFYAVGSRELIQNLDILPIPDRNLLNMEFYTRPHIGREFFGRYATLFSSRGCLMRCHYCAGPLMFKGKVRYHSPDYVIEEMRRLVRLYKVNYIYFADDMFLVDRERLESICKKIKKISLHRKVKWICQLTAGSADLDILKLMKNSGCILIECGFESGSQEELDRMNKRIKVSKYYEFASLTRKAGIRFRANMIKGYIDQTESDFNLSINIINSVKPYCANFNQFWPLPGTVAYKELLKRGYKISWHDCTDFKQNFTKISNARSIKLSEEAQKKIIDPLNKSNFIKYHLVHHPIFSLKKAINKLVLRGRG